MAAGNPGTDASAASRLVRWAVAVALALVLSHSLARAEDDVVRDPRGPYFCLRSIACRPGCPTRHDASCSMACSSAALLCQAYRTNDAPLFRGALLGWASARFLQAYRKQHRPSEPRAINRVGELVAQCESAQQVEREDCANLAGAWARMIVRRRQQPAGRNAAGMACAREARTIPDTVFAAAFVAWARRHPWDWDLSAGAGIEVAVATLGTCPDAKVG